jgi:hypothetical protein
LTYEALLIPDLLGISVNTLTIYIPLLLVPLELLLFFCLLTVVPSNVTMPRVAGSYPAARARTSQRLLFLLNLLNLAYTAASIALLGLDVCAPLFMFCFELIPGSTWSSPDVIPATTKTAINGYVCFVVWLTLKLAGSASQMFCVAQYVRAKRAQTSGRPPKNTAVCGRSG